MSILLHHDALLARRTISAGALAPLADSLRHDLAPLLNGSEIFIPAEKARLTRKGGWCPEHGTSLEFDPWRPRAHRCLLCQRDYTDDEHYRWWIMFYQLWLAERAVHAATLYALRGDAACGSLATHILGAYAERYLEYPNVDNVLGPTRPFFSTYLESIWTLQLTIALDLVEAIDGQTALGERVRSQLIAPSAQLIASFDEGRSNRQVWNNAALAAAGVLLGDASLVDRVINSESGLVAHTRNALLADGTWYEGENYHLFAHRGLWYVTVIAEAQGWTPPPETSRRIAEGFAAPFATALPDLTFPSRRDSQYKVSLRQWRIAESCELGLAHGDDPRLRAALAEMYREDVAPGDTGRARSTAEAERNVPAARLTRDSLGWKSLLFAKEMLPVLSSAHAHSALLPGQGLGVLRRAHGRVYVALDYGESGGGHGHPDRLNLWLVDGDARVLEDVGTGAYVDPSLHWYRSTLAHNAPLVDGRSQWRISGELLAWDERGDMGWISASAEIAPGVRVRRSVVAVDDYLVDELAWEGARVVTIDVPWHVDASLEGDEHFRAASLGGGSGLEDGFAHVSHAENMPGDSVRRLMVQLPPNETRAWIGCDAPHEWWRCVAPGPPGSAPRPFIMLRAREKSGCMRSVWTWGADVDRVDIRPESIIVHRFGVRRDEHRRVADGWEVRRVDDRRTSTVLLVTTQRETSNDRESELEAQDTWGHADTTENVAAGGLSDASPDTQANVTPSIAIPVFSEISPQLGDLLRDAGDTNEVATRTLGTQRPIRFRLSRAHYRRSEASWEVAGRPEAVVAIAATPTHLVLEVGVRKRPLAFAPACSENPLDNEHPDTNSDGLQFYLSPADDDGRYYSWIIVPDESDGSLRVTPRTVFGTPIVLGSSWRPTPGGYLVRLVVPRVAPGGGRALLHTFSLDLIVNEKPPERERRRGQLVLSGGFNETIYLRGDRQDAARALHFSIDDR